MLILGSLLFDKVELSLGRVEQRLLLREIEARCHSTFVAGVDQLQSFLLDGNGFTDHLRFGVKLA